MLLGDVTENRYLHFSSSRISNMVQLVIGKDVHCFEGKNCLHHRVREGQSWKDAEVT